MQAELKEMKAERQATYGAEQGQVRAVGQDELVYIAPDDIARWHTPFNQPGEAPPQDEAPAGCGQHAVIQLNR